MLDQVYWQSSDIISLTLSWLLFLNYLSLPSHNLLNFILPSQDWYFFLLPFLSYHWNHDFTPKSRLTSKTHTTIHLLIQSIPDFFFPLSSFTHSFIHSLSKYLFHDYHHHFLENLYLTLSLSLFRILFSTITIEIRSRNVRSDLDLADQRFHLDNNHHQPYILLFNLFQTKLPLSCFLLSSSPCSSNLSLSALLYFLYCSISLSW